MSATIWLQCPNEDCQESFAVEVEQTAPYIPARITQAWEDSSPAEGPDYDVRGPFACACGEPLDTPALSDEAIERFERGGACG